MTAPQDNPLLRSFTAPHGAPPLDVVQPAHFLPAIRDAVENARKSIAVIRDNAAPADFENTIEALEFSRYPLRRISNIYTNLSAVKNSDALMEAGGEIKSALSRHASDMMTDAKLFARVKSVYGARGKLKLDGEQAMLLERTYRAFVRNGALLGDNAKAALTELDAQIAARTTDFQNNMLKSIGGYKKIISDESALAGVPERLKTQYREAAEEAGLSGQWLVRLLPPPHDLLESAQNRALREEIYLAMGNVANGGAHDNNPVVIEIARLRHEKAKLLGYENYAAFILEERMAKTPAGVLDFLDKTEAVYRPAAEAQLKEIRALAREEDGIADFQPWDFTYYNRKLQEKTYGIDVEELRPYFPLENVLEGLRIHVGKLFDITLDEQPAGKYPVYHQDVRVYEVADRSGGEILGVMYGDFYARPGEKGNGAWMDVFRNRGMKDESGDDFAIIINCLNLAKPTAETPSLLSLEDVRTVFHEFGHGLHAILARGKYATQNGINVKWDFIELPSQLQENWVLEESVMRGFAKHCKTGETLPAGLMEKAIRLETFNAGYNGMLLNFRSVLDMTWHMTDPADIESAAKLEEAVAKTDSIFPPGRTLKSTSFDHIFCGGHDYAAGYYSYKWAEVLDADIFESFREKGLYDKETAQRLREIIYAKGATVEPDELFREMKGRDPDPDALFRREGLAGEEQAV
ncbi:MAG: M3 family peptidase [Alphaproteobacteria bacterium]|nr:M3 family peptidase [Alphaproteobacteria bacterium]